MHPDDIVIDPQHQSRVAIDANYVEETDLRMVLTLLSRRL